MTLKSFFMAALLMSAVSYPALAAENPSPEKWGSHIETEGKWGSERSIGEGGLFVPLWQNDNAMIFTDLRGRWDNHDSQEYNIGLGYRQIVNDDWIFGGYGFYDHRKTGNDNHFDQATFGIEALSPEYEARLNAYIPESTEKLASAGGTSAVVSGAQIQIRQTGPGFERALPGFDVEFGRGFDLSNNWKLWVYGGGFYFNADDYEEVTGPRGRLEVSYSNLPYLNEGSRFTLGVESQHDDVRGEETFGIARLRLPLSAFKGEQAYPKSNLSDLEKRMTSRIIRDVDIVAGAKAGKVTTENATATILGSAPFSQVKVLRAGDDIATEVSAASSDTLIVFDGSAGVINTNVPIVTNIGQTLTSGGITLTVTGDTSLITKDLVISGSRATIHGLDEYEDVFEVGGDYATLTGFNITGGFRGILSYDVDNTSISDIHLNNTGETAISFEESSGTVEDVIINTTGRDGIEVTSNSNVVINNADITGAANSGVFQRASTAQINDSYIHGTIGDGIYSYISGNLTMNNTTIEDTGASGLVLFDTNLSGSGNILINPTTIPCYNGGGNTGSIAFDDLAGGGSGTCP